jgi:ribosomal protein L11 methyltransferase
VASVPGTFDVVVANIGVRVLVDEAADLVARVAPGGTIVLGGIIAERLAEVTATYAGVGVVDAPIDELDGWVGLTWRPPRPEDRRSRPP